MSSKSKEWLLPYFLKVHLSVSLQGARNNPLLELTLLTYKIIILTKTLKTLYILAYVHYRKVFSKEQVEMNEGYSY